MSWARSSEGSFALSGSLKREISPVLLEHMDGPDMGMSGLDAFNPSYPAFSLTDDGIRTPAAGSAVGKSLRLGTAWEPY